MLIVPYNVQNSRISEPYGFSQSARDTDSLNTPSIQFIGEFAFKNSYCMEQSALVAQHCVSHHPARGTTSVRPRYGARHIDKTLTPSVIVGDPSAANFSGPVLATEPTPKQ